MASRSFDSSATANVHIYMFACAATCGTVPYRTRRLGSIPLYASLPTLINSVVSTGSATPLYGFVGATVLATTMMGGTYAIMPAYEADLYGAKYVGAIHGRFLLFGASMAGVFGPALILQLRAQSESRAM